MAAEVAAGIVLYRPDPAILLRGIAALEPQCDRLFLYANGPLDPALAAALAARHPAATLLRGDTNDGIAAALNRLAAAAEAAGFWRIALFDQDSEAPPGLVPVLVQAAERLRGAGEQAAAVGPSLLASPEAGERHKPPRLFVRPGKAPVGRLAPVWFLPTSGTLLDLAAFCAIGPFREDYFIDAVDLEWGFRAWSRGYSCWADLDAAMTHRVGSGTIDAKALGLSMPRQQPVRMATYLRNNLYGWRLPHIPPGWKLRQAAYLPLQAWLYWRASGYDREVGRLLLQACLDGLRGRLGRPAGLP